MTLMRLQQDRASHSGFGKDSGPAQHLERSSNVPSRQPAAGSEWSETVTPQRKHTAMSKPILHEPSENLLATSEAPRGELPIAEGRPADAEMARVLHTK